MKIEVWSTPDNKREIHLFNEEGTNDYVLGFNPEKICVASVIKMLDENGLVIADHNMIDLASKLIKAVEEK